MTTILSAHSAVRASTAQEALALAPYALDVHQEAQMTIPTRQHRASRVWLGKLQQRLPLDRVRSASRVSTLLQQPDYARTAPPARRMMTLNPVRCVLDAWQASTQRQVMPAHVVLVERGASVLPMVVPVPRCVRCAERASILRKDQMPVRSAQLVQQMKTAIHRLHVCNVTRAGSLDAVRHRAMSVQLVRPTVTSIPRRRVQHAWLVSTGRLRQL